MGSPISSALAIEADDCSSMRSTLTDYQHVFPNDGTSAFAGPTPIRPNRALMASFSAWVPFGVFCPADLPRSEIRAPPTRDLPSNREAMWSYQRLLPNAETLGEIDVYHFRHTLLMVQSSAVSHLSPNYEVIRARCDNYE